MEPLRPFKPIPPTAEKVSELKRWAADNGMNPDHVDAGLDKDRSADWFGNDLYVVIRADIGSPGGWPEMVWLSIRRQDREAVHDWRHFQQIKNELVGPECEAIEIYPAESRLVDAANQYHLWCFKQPGERWPVGFQERYVTFDAAEYKTGAVQRAASKG